MSSTTLAANARVSVAGFTTAPVDFKEIKCRQVGPIKTPTGETFSGFIREAFIRELNRLNLYAPTAPIQITGTITVLDFSSVAGTWDSELLLKSSNGKEMRLLDLYRFQPHWYGNKACENAAAAFMPAVQQLLGKVLSSSEFAALATP